MSAAARAGALLLDMLGERIELDAPLGARTTYRVGGSATALLIAEDVKDLQAVADAVRETQTPVLVVGRGSNLLVADQGVDAVAVVLGEGFARVALIGERVHAGGGALLPVVARRTAAAGLRGFEWAVGVPGSIGGAVRMNAGGHGSEMAEVLERVHVFDLLSGDDSAVDIDELALGYRSSAVLPHQVVVSADLRLETGDVAGAEDEIAEIVRWRRTNQPGGANAGSVFTNPPEDSAGRLIEAVGAKGLRVRTAMVSEKHANFIQVDDGGSAADVVALMAQVRAKVEERFGVVLDVETRFAGFDPVPFASASPRGLRP